MTKQSSSSRTRVSLRSAAVLGVLAGVAAFSSGLLRGSMPDVQTGTWVATGTLSTVRSASSAVLLPSGGVLVTGGADASASLDTVDLFGSDGTFVAAAPMGEARADHTAVALEDGRVLVMGGRNGNGAVGSAETFADGVWTTIPGLTDARWGHTATVLKDGRVLVAGGENVAGAVMSLELYDPETGVFAVAGTMASPRKGHAAARLSDGRVLIAGGATDDAVLATTEIFDPETLQLAAGPSLNTARAGLTATTLLDGRAVFIGGYNGTQNVASAEIYSDVTNAITYTASATPMVARRDHQAFLLPNNNAVLIVGGIAEAMVDGVLTARETSAAELYLPWLNEVWQTSGMTVARADASGAALSTESYGAESAGEGLVMVAGGAGQASSEAYRFATIRTDKDDYAPGMKVYVSGTGWQPLETVTFALRELPAEHASRTFSIEADEQGRIDSAFLFDVEEHHLGVRFYLTARGASSQAQTTFTDGNFRFLSSGPTFSVNWQRYTNSSCTTPKSGVGSSGSGSITASDSTSGTLEVPVPAGEYLGLTAPATTGGQTFQSWEELSGGPTFTTSGPGSRTICVAGDNSSGLRRIRADYASTTLATTLTVTAVSGPYNGVANLDATLTAASSGVSGKTITFSLNGSPAGSAMTDASGTASLTGVSLSGINVGAYAGGVVASFAGDPSHDASNGTASLTVNKANQTITFPQPGTPAAYNSAFAVAATSDSGLPVSIAATGACSIASGTVTMTSGTGTCTLTASQGGDDNYEAAIDVVRTVVASKALQTITFAAPSSPAEYSTTFAVAPTSDSGLTVTVQATGVCSISSGTVTMTSGTGACTLTASQAGSDNYSPAADVVHTVTASKANQTITFATPLSPATYDSTFTVAPTSDSALTVTVGATGACSIASGTVTMTSGTGTCSLTASQTGDDNYNAASDVVHTVAAAKASQTITFAPPASPAMYYTSFVVSPTSDSSLPVSVGAAGACSIAGTIVSMNSGTGTCTLTATQPGDDNYSAAAEVVHTVAATKADAVISVTGYTGTYDGNAHGASGTAVGIEEIPVDLNALLNFGETFTTVPGGTANWSFAGNDNYNATTGTANINISKADAVLNVTGYTGVYDGAAHGATGTATGVQSEDLSALLDLGDSFTNVPGGTANWSFAGNGNYNPASGTAPITISKAPTTTVVTCAAGPLFYTGVAQTPCSASVTGAGGLTETLTVTYTDNVNAGTATASAAYAESANHLGSSDSETFEIAKATAVISVVGFSGVYDGQPHGVTSNSATGVNAEALSGLVIEPTTYTNVPGGTIAWTFTNANYADQSGAATVTITRRLATIAAESESKTYGDVNPELSATVTGTVNSDVLNYTLASTAGQFSPVGPYPITVTPGSNPNYNVSAVNGTLTITARPITVTVDPQVKILGAPDPVLTYQITSGNLVNGDTFTGGLTRAPGESIGSYPIGQGTLTLGPNYQLTFVGANLQIVYLWTGFLQPVTNTAHDQHALAVYSSFKTGQTIPLKFELKDAFGNIVVQTSNPIFMRTGNLGACESAEVPDDLIGSIAPDSDGLYKTTGTQYHYGWNTKGLTRGLYLVYAKLADGTQQSAAICLTK